MLAHSAGIQRYGTATTTSEEQWEEVRSVNLTSAFLMSQHVLPGMIEEGGAIILVGSVQSVGAFGNSAAYVTSKHAMLGLARSIALDFARSGVRCYCVCPGAIDTPMLRASAALDADPAGVLRACERLHLFKRLGQPDEVARVITFLASSDASSMTGTAIMVDGGCMVPIGGDAFNEEGTGRCCGRVRPEFAGEILSLTPCRVHSLRSVHGVSRGDPELRRSQTDFTAHKCDADSLRWPTIPTLAATQPAPRRSAACATSDVTAWETLERPAETVPLLADHRDLLSRRSTGAA